MLTINELFSGIGAQVAALKRLGIRYEIVGISEIDTAAIQSYERMNGKTRNYGDISKIEKLDYADLWTYSFPCQDLSVAGKQAGIKEGTRSGLLLEVERLLENAVLLGNQPKYLLLENVKALVGKKFKPDFDRWLNKLSELGYNNYWKVLNAKDFGIPQNRERVFVVSIRKDLNQIYMFPEPVPLTLKLKDLLESEVDEKYYLPQEKVEQQAVNLNKDVSNTIRCGGGGSLDGKHTWDIVIAASRGRNPSSREAGLPTEQVNSSGVSNTLTTVQKDNLVVEPQIKLVGNVYYPDKNYGTGYAGATYDPSGIIATLTTMGGGNREPCVIEPINTCADGSCQALTAHLHKETANDCTKFERHSPATGVLEIGIGHNPISKKFEFDGFHDQPAPTLLATNYKAPKCYSDGIRIRKEYEVGNIQESRHNMTEMQPRTDSISNTITTVQKDNMLCEPKERFFKQAIETFEQNECNVGDTVDAFNKRINNTGCSPTLTTRPEGFKTAILPVVNPVGYNYYNKLEINDIAPTQTTACGYPKTSASVLIPTDVKPSLRIRKLTPKECWRLMGFTDEEFDKAKGKFLRIENRPVFKIGSDGLNHKVGTTPTEVYEQSNTQLYKQAGNSIVVNVLVAIFKNLNLE